MIYIALIILTLNIGTYFICYILYTKGDNKKSHKTEDLLSVSILISVRNEAENIQALFDELNGLDYPKEKLQILIGDDMSADDTLMELRKHQSESIEVYEIQEGSRLIGKMNALDQLSKKASGDFLFFTDANVKIDPQWVRSMLRHADDDLAMLGGFVYSSGNSILQKLQCLDLIIHQAMLKVLALLDLLPTILGKNMMVNHKHFQKIQGYDNIKFNITEDVALLMALKNKGGEVYLLHSSETTIEAEGKSNYGELLQQRIRWYHAMRPQPMWLKFSWMIKLLWLPALIFSIFLNFNFAIFFVVKMVLVILISQKVTSTIQRPNPWKHIILFELYEPLLYIITFLFGSLPIKKIWKDRSY